MDKQNLSEKKIDVPFCYCRECKHQFSEPTGGGACPICGGSDWIEYGN